MTKIRIEDSVLPKGPNIFGGYDIEMFMHYKAFRVYGIDDHFVVVTCPAEVLPLSVKHNLDEAMDLAYQEALSHAETLKDVCRNPKIINETSRFKESQLEAASTEQSIPVGDGGE